MSFYHNESFCDGLLAAVAVLSITGPVVFLTVELSFSFIVPVRQDTATFTTPKIKRETDKRDGETIRWQKDETRGDARLGLD